MSKELKLVLISLVLVLFGLAMVLLDNAGCKKVVYQDNYGSHYVQVCKA